MAIVKYGSLPPLNRSFGGATFSANFNGSIIRTHKKGINYKSIRNSVRRTNFLNVVQHWRTLSQFNKTGWSDYRLEVPRVNSLGETYFLTGFQLFTAVNQVRVNQGFSIQEFPEDPDPTLPVFITAIDFDIDPVDLRTHYLPATVQSNVELRFWGTAIYSNGLELIFPDRFKLLTTIPPGSVSPLLLGPLWQSVYGSGPVNISGITLNWSAFFAVETYDFDTNTLLLQDQFKATIIT